MNEGSTIFSQLIAHASRDALDRCIRRYQGNHRVRTLAAETSSWSWPSPSSPIVKACATSKPA
jgi:hypothetical protein